MYNQSWRESDLLFRVKLLKDKVAKWESGEKYRQMKEEHSRELAKKDQEIKKLEKELARSHAETIDVRNKWAQTCEDVLDEKEKELAQKNRELKEMEARMFEAFRQRDEALEKYRKKNQELYDVMTRLEEEQGKNQELTARVKKDYTNSSKSSSMSPDHKKIQNNREKTGRRPGGQPGHIHHGRKMREPNKTILIPAPEEYTDCTVISDHESTFQNYGNRHQECMVHVERYLRSSIENEPGLTWNQQMLEWVQSAIHYWKTTHEEGSVDEKKILEFEHRYDEILEKAKEEYEYEPPSKYFKDGYNCYKRMESDKQDYILFLKDPTVASTNNEAERAGRKFKRKASQVMGFRSSEGFGYFCDGLSVTQTWKAKGVKLYQAVVSCFNSPK